MTRDIRLKAVGRLAAALDREFRVPAQLLVAQWAVESRWGERPVGFANYFGIKKASRHEKSAWATTREVINGQSTVQRLEFADYNSLEASCRDYAWLISHGAPYKRVWDAYITTGDVDNLILGVAKVYATAPSYAALLLQISKQENVKAATRGNVGN